MKLIPSLLVIGMLFSMILNSCSIEKRIYRSGYHIEWKRFKHVQEVQELSSTEKALNKESETKLVISRNDLVAQEINTESVSEIVPSDTELTNSEKSVSNYETKMDRKDNSLVPSASESDREMGYSLSQKETFNSTVHGALKGFSEGKSGVLMLIIGLVLLGLAWVFYTYLGIIGLIFAIIFGIGGAVYIIAGIIMMIANA